LFSTDGLCPTRAPSAPGSLTCTRRPGASSPRAGGSRRGGHHGCCSGLRSTGGPIGSGVRSTRRWADLSGHGSTRGPEAVECDTWSHRKRRTGDCAELTAF
jgi:hypothetical protein